MGEQGKWEFRSRFRTNAFGWKGSALAIKRIGEAVKEIRKTKDPIFRAEGAILLFERLWPTLQRIDSSSGSLGTATNKAVHELAQFIIDAPCNDQVRAKWLEKLWQAMEDDGVDYLSEVGERWGELCVSRTVASRWADELRSTLELSWERGGYFRPCTTVRAPPSLSECRVSKNSRDSKYYESKHHNIARSEISSPNFCYTYFCYTWGDMKRKHILIVLLFTTIKMVVATQGYAESYDEIVTLYLNSAGGFG